MVELPLCIILNTWTYIGFCYIRHYVGERAHPTWRIILRS